MCFLFPLAVQFIFLQSLKANYPELQHKYAQFDDVEGELDGYLAKEKCPKPIYFTLEDYSSHAIITRRCVVKDSEGNFIEKRELLYGYIISRKSILSYSDKVLMGTAGSDCDATVDILADRSVYEGELKQEDGVVVFNLKKPLPESRESTVMQMVEASPRPGTSAYRIGLCYNYTNDQFQEKMLHGTKLIESQNFEDIYTMVDPFQSDATEPDDPRDLLWINQTSNGCDRDVIVSSLLVDGRLAGLQPKLSYIYNKENKVGFIDVARLRPTIKRLTGI
ncbi:hypothetical protein QAD02_017977 [Eretmocerus hayati]|uniref:Uncharacterized protein n=1 Tax=Eretmocerus hayati TaxID=131215 RepID=A0ACC2PK76_9HYME|nr:hypothetical protein QAD02_017977 [Eretmocerus hayati]